MSHLHKDDVKAIVINYNPENISTDYSETSRELSSFLDLAADKQFILDAKKIEFDGVADNGKILNYAIGEHLIWRMLECTVEMRRRIYLHRNFISRRFV